MRFQMRNWTENQANRYDPALEAQRELERSNKRAHWIEFTLGGIGALLVLSVAKLHLSTLTGKVAGVVGPLCLLASWAVSMWARSKEDGPEYVSILGTKLEPRGDDRTRM
jgi:hypothetical protein